MTRRLRIFLAGDLQTYAVEEFSSNHDVFLWFKEKLERHYEGKIEIIHVIDPVGTKISDAVKNAIRMADCCICVFPRRSHDQLLGLWTTSSYVLSESGYALSCLDPEASSKMFAFVENGVDENQLGIAFARDQTFYRFDRRKLEETALPNLQRVVSNLLRVSQHDDRPRHEMINKVVTVRRNGWVYIESHHRFRMQLDGEFSRSHSIWRVREPLPPFVRLRDAIPSHQNEFLVCIPIRVGDNEVDPDCLNLSPKFNNGNVESRTLQFELKFADVGLKIGDIVEYRLAWQYKNAFGESQANNGFPQSAGLWSCGSHHVEDAKLTLRFERNIHEGKCQPILSMKPSERIQVFSRCEPCFPHGGGIDEFWHQDTNWQSAGHMEKNLSEQEALFECHSWSCNRFSGMVRARWDFSHNYLHLDSRNHSESDTGDESSYRNEDREQDGN
ncbi:MAG: hypothetical protein U0930_04700 [Pirellulales bacterium]